LTAPSPSPSHLGHRSKFPGSSILLTLAAIACVAILGWVSSFALSGARDATGANRPPQLVQAWIVDANRLAHGVGSGGVLRVAVVSNRDSTLYWIASSNHQAISHGVLRVTAGNVDDFGVPTTGVTAHSWLQIKISGAPRPLTVRVT
jgi:hypothetical protein